MSVSESRLDRLLNTLADERRRLSLSILARERSLPVSELATEVARRTVDGSVSDDDRVERLQVQLSHVHLPKLDDAGLVSHTREASTVSVPPEQTEAESAFSAAVRTVRDESPTLFEGNGPQG